MDKKYLIKTIEQLIAEGAGHYNGNISFGDFYISREHERIYGKVVTIKSMSCYIEGESSPIFSFWLKEDIKKFMSAFATEITQQNECGFRDGLFE